MTDRRRWLCCVALCATWWCVAPARVRAEDEEESAKPAFRLEPMVISATRTDLSEDMPSASVTVLDKEDVDTSADVAVDDILRTVPGFSLYRRSSSTVTSPDLDPEAQGVTLRNLGPAGTSRALVLVDGIPLIDPYDGQVFWGKISKEQIDHIEVVRGGLSNLWGNYAMAGVINIVTKKPDKNEVTAKASYGMRGLTDDNVLVHGRADKLGVTLEGHFFDTDGFPVVAFDQRGPIDGNSSSRDEAFNGRVSYDLSETTSIALGGQFFDQDYNNGTPLRTSGTQSGRINLSGVTRSEDGSEWQGLIYSNMQSFHIQFTEVNEPRTTEHKTLFQTIDYTDVAGSLVWSKQVAQPLLLTGGVDLHWIDGRDTDDFYDEDGLAIEETQRSDGKQFFTGLFLNAVFAPSPKWQVTLGGRLDVWNNYDGTQTLTPDTGPATVNGFSGTTDVTFNPKLGVFYTVNDWLQLRGALYRAFRAPTLAELYRQSMVEGLTLLPNPNLGAEHLFGGELGFDLPLAKSLDFRTTGFFDYIDNPVTNVSTAFGPDGEAVTRMRENLGQARTVGCELEALYQVLPDVQLSASYLFTDGTITSSPAEPDLEGKQLAQIPRNSATIGGRYSNPELFTLALEGRFVDGQFEDEDNLDPMIGYWLLNANLSRHFDLPHVAGEVFVAAENLLDRAYIVDRGGGIFKNGTPISVWGGLRVRF